MEIKTIGKFLVQFEQVKADFLNLLENISQKESEDCLLLINNATQKDKKKQAYLNLKDKEYLELVLKYSSILSSMNKSKGTHLEDILNYIFDRNNYFDNKSKITWEDNILVKRLPLETFRLNNKIVHKYKPILLEKFKKIKTITFTNLNSLNTIDKRICNFLKDNNDFKENLEFLKYENEVLEQADYYKVYIKFKKPVLIDDILIDFLYKVKLLSTFDLKTIKTDSTVEDIKNKRIFIVECKNVEKTGLTLQDIWKTVSYAIREKEFNKKKFKKIILAYRGKITEEVLNNLEDVNYNFENYAGAKLELKSFEDFIDYLKEEYFDDETKKIYKKKNISCFDLDKIKYRLSESHEKRIYTPIYLFENRKDNKIIIDMDYIYKFDLKKKIFSLEKEKIKDKQDTERKELNKESKRLLKNE